MRYKIAMYKYKPLLCLSEIKHLEDNLSQKVWMPPLKSVNDPFEGCFKYKSLPPNLIQNNAEMLNFYLNFHRNNGEPNLTRKEFRARLENPQFHEALLAEDGKKLFYDFFSNFSVLSLTKCASNIPMWAHYGNNHQGICIIFEVDFTDIIKQTDQSLQAILNGEGVSFSPNSKDDIGLRFAFSKISYREQPQTFCHQEFIQIKDDYSKMEYILKKALAVKFHQWDYEDEYRLIANQNSMRGDLMDLRRYAPFIKVTGLIMGKNLGIKNIIEDMSRRFCVDLYQASCSDSEYKITMKKTLDHGRETELLEPLCECKCLAMA